MVRVTALEKRHLPLGLHFVDTGIMLPVPIAVEKKKLGRPRGERYSIPLPIRLNQGQSAALDAWRLAQPDRPSCSQAVRE